MSVFDDMLEQSAGAFDALGAETITFTPRGGSAYPLLALVDRDPPAQRGEVRMSAYRVDVKNKVNTGVAATAGVDVTSSAMIGGKFTVKRRPGSSETVELEIRQESLRSQDAGRLAFEF